MSLGGFDGLDHGHLLARADLAACFRQIDEDNISQLVLRMIGDANGSGVVGRSDPLVGFAVAEVVGDVAHVSSGVGFMIKRLLARLGGIALAADIDLDRCAGFACSDGRQAMPMPLPREW